MNYYIGLDLGTSGVKAVIFDKHGNEINSFYREYDIISNNPNEAEEDPNIWLSKTLEIIEEIKKLDIKKDIKSMGISGQMHGLVLLDENDNVLRNAIIWCDNRTKNETEYLSNTLGDDYIMNITGNIPVSAFTITKLLWVKKNEPNIYKKIKKVLLPKDYLSYMLTNTFYTEYSDASGMGILDIEKLEYSKELLDKLDIDINLFPKLIKSTDIRGNLKKEFDLNINLVGGAGDQAAGAVGAGVVNSDELSIVLGSSGVVYSPLDKINKNKNVQIFSTCEYKTYHIMGVTNGCGTSLKWLKHNIFKKDYDEMMDLASNSNGVESGLYYLPYIMGERTPILDNDAKGIFIGLKNTTNDGDMIRSVLEGIGFSIKDCFNLIDVKKNSVIISGGGAKSELFRTIIASMINKEVKRIKSDEAPSLGAAILAMVGNKEYKSIDSACKKIIKIKDITKPDKKLVKLYDEKYPIYKKIYINNKDLFKEI